MNAVTRHAPDAMLAAYAAGSLPSPFALVVAAHISLCAECRAALEAHQAVGGVVLEGIGLADLSSGLKVDVLARLDQPAAPELHFSRSGIFPGPVMAALKGQPPRWKSLGLGVRQCILSFDSEGSTRLIYIPPGQEVPGHSHNGMELTLVLQGSFSDDTGHFGVGDVETAGDELAHTPKAGEGAPCICLAATDAPLRFTSWLPQVLQPLFRI